jgi:hypothetical protein
MRAIVAVALGAGAVLTVIACDIGLNLGDLTGGHAGDSGTPGSVEILATGQPQGVVVDDSFIYWADLGGSIQKLAKDALDAGPTLVADATSPTLVTISPTADRVCWLSSIITVQKDSGTTVNGATCLELSDGGTSIVMKATAGLTLTGVTGSGFTVDVCTANSPSPRVVDCYQNDCVIGNTAQCIATVGADGGDDPCSALAMGPGGSELYWADSHGTVFLGATMGTSGQACTMPDGGTPVASTGGGAATSLAVDGVNVYWTTASAVMFAPSLQSGSVPAGATLYAPGAATLGRLAIDDSNVYWIDRNSILTCPKSGCVQGVPTTVASGQDGPAYLAVDGDGGYVYWTNTGDTGSGTLNRALKP